MESLPVTLAWLGIRSIGTDGEKALVSKLVGRIGHRDVVRSNSSSQDELEKGPKSNARRIWRIEC